MPKIKNHYKTLGVSTGASARDILKARNKLLRRHHPDMNQGREDEAKERTIGILMAADVLLDEGSRAEYDRLYYIHFGVAAIKAEGDERKAGDRQGPASSRNASDGPAPGVGAHAGDAYTRNASTDGGRYRVVVCGYCNKNNVNPKKNYCMFCGAGIGDNPRAFSFDDVSDEIIDMYYSILREETKPKFGVFSKQKELVIGGVVLLALLFLQLAYKDDGVYYFIAAFLFIVLIWMAWTVGLIVYDYVMPLLRRMK